MEIKVLFVCLGNICRSPMAEAVFRDLIIREGLEKEVLVDSAGTGNWHEGKPPHHGTRGILSKYNINFDGIRARQIVRHDLTIFTYIVVMDQGNYLNVKKMSHAETTGTIVKLLDYVEQINEKDVPDPYYTGNFDEVYALVKAGCENLLAEIKNSYDLKGEK